MNIPIIINHINKINLRLIIPRRNISTTTNNITTTTNENPYNAYTFIPSILPSPTSKKSIVTNICGKKIAIKANFCVKGWPSDACSKILQGFIAPYSATAVERLENAGAILCGLTNMDEFGMGSEGYTSIYGPTQNPHCPTRSPGGSSSGSAVAVATNSCFAALGSDTGGSVRLPASHCGIVGFKPSRGRISRWGLIAYANSLDTPAILAKNVDDIISVANIVCGPDDKDETCIPTPWKIINNNSTTINFSQQLKIGIPLELVNVAELDADIRKIWKNTLQLLTHLGVNLVPISLPHLIHALPTYYVLAMTEASSNLARYDGIRYGYRCVNSLEELTKKKYSLWEEYSKTRSEGFGINVKERLVMGSLALSMRDEFNSYNKALKVRSQIKQDFNNAFQHCNVMILPTSTKIPPLLPNINCGEQCEDNIIDSFVQDLMTVPASLGDLPAISVPVDWISVTERSSSSNTSQIPIGMQIIGGFGEDEQVLNCAKGLEKVLNFTNNQQPNTR
jgi:aspartyl-tRNA(Asn)/glutamyl-tRNA(Gln) amidotransferase subunit A